MMADDVESLTASLVREYLSRKGLKNSLTVMDQEMPRDEQSISNRAQLAKEIHIERLMKKNKEHTIVYRTMLEVIVQYFREKGLSSSTTNVVKKPATAVHDTTRPSTAGFRSARERRLSADKTKKADKPSELTENSSEDKLDYIDILHRLEKSERVPKNRESKEVVHMSSIPLTDNIPPAKETSSGSFTPMKTHRSRTRSAGMAGPVISSGLAGTRGKRPGHTKSQTSELAITGHKFQADKTSSEDVSVQRHTDTLSKDDILSSEKEENTRVLSARKSEVQNHIFNKSTHISDKIDKVKKDTTLRPGSSAGPRKNYQQQKEELVFEDIDDDLDDSIGQLSLGPTQSIMTDFESKPISLEQAMALKNLIFGSAKSCFNQEWRQQSFNFCDHYDLEYGIVQHKGGSCGVLAAVQALVIKNLLFGEQRKSDPRSCLQPLPHERSKALASSITEILWQAGDFKSATVALPAGFGSSNFVGAGRYKPDQLTENLVLRTYTSRDGLYNYVNQQIKQFEDQSSSGCILLLYSTILSRTIKKVTSDMDDPNNKLMGAHGYCSQEMVNLIITGRATSNAFDNVIELDSGGSAAAVVLKGLDKQADVGFLSLFEHYGSCQVGMNYKNPKFPIWVVCSESHFSVLFSIYRTLLEEWSPFISLRCKGTAIFQVRTETVKETIDEDQKTRFDLYYYDGLSRQDEEIRLTVDTSQECPDYQDGDLVPPLEHVIRTRWKKAVIDWNGTEPIL